MAGIFDVRAIFQKAQYFLFGSGKMKEELMDALNLTADEADMLFREIVGSWRHGVDFDRDGPNETGGDLVITITTDDEPFFYLNEGTLVRRSIMGKGFSPKTSVRSYRSGAGCPPYDPVFVGKNINNPGIDARERTPMMADDLQKSIERNVNIKISKV